MVLVPSFINVKFLQYLCLAKSQMGISSTLGALFLYFPKTADVKAIQKSILYRKQNRWGCILCIIYFLFISKWQLIAGLDFFRSRVSLWSYTFLKFFTLWSYFNNISVTVGSQANLKNNSPPGENTWLLYWNFAHPNHSANFILSFHLELFSCCSAVGK